MQQTPQKPAADAEENENESVDNHVPGIPVHLGKLRLECLRTTNAVGRHQEGFLGGQSFALELQHGVADVRLQLRQVFGFDLR